VIGYPEDVTIEGALQRALTREPTISCAWLFGSTARGTARADSDVDVGVIGDPPHDRLAWRFELEARLSAAVGRSVQVVEVDRAPADLVRRVLRDGHLLLDRDRARRVAVEVRKRNEYFDLTPVWRMIRRLPRSVAP
jgi:predicted nucleotidyltransferase